MNRALVRRAIRLHPMTPGADRGAVKALRRGWIRAVETLGDRWILARPVNPAKGTK